MPDDDDTAPAGPGVGAAVPEGAPPADAPAIPSPDVAGSQVDEESDESFPASDPPANY